jgi:DNA-binding GntR family transcriptional regulator
MEYHMRSSTPLLRRAVDHWSGQLLADGYCVIPGLLPTDLIEGLDADLAADFETTPFCRGAFYGERTRRFGRLLMRSPRAERLVRHELVLGIVQTILSPWCDTVQLNLTQALSLDPGAPPQLPHRDQDMWRGAIGEMEYLVNVMWPFTRYTAENGATLVWPGSHGRRALDPEPPAGPLPVELEPGSALLFLGSTLHGAGGNSSGEVRRGAIVSYCLGWLKPYENQWLAYPPEVARGSARSLRRWSATPSTAPTSAISKGNALPSCWRTRCPSAWARSTRFGRTRRSWWPSSSAARTGPGALRLEAMSMSPAGTFERVYAAIKDQLQRGMFGPGERLEPAALGYQLNSSVTPVRDALHRLTGERLVESPRHDGFRAPMLTETALRHLYAWHRDLLLLALARRTLAPVPGPAGEDDQQAAGLDDRRNALFLALAASGGNPEHVLAFTSLLERMAPVQRLEDKFLDALGPEIATIAGAVEAGDRKTLRSSLVRYHRRRERIVPELLAGLQEAGTRA